MYKKTCCRLPHWRGQGAHVHKTIADCAIALASRFATSCGLPGTPSWCPGLARTTSPATALLSPNVVAGGMSPNSQNATIHSKLVDSKPLAAEPRLRLMLKTRPVVAAGMPPNAQNATSYSNVAETKPAAAEPKVTLMLRMKHVMAAGLPPHSQNAASHSNTARSKPALAEPKLTQILMRRMRPHYAMQPQRIVESDQTTH